MAGVLIPGGGVYGARRFYERHGYEAVAFTDGSGNEERCPDVLYERRGADAAA